MTLGFLSTYEKQTAELLSRNLHISLRVASQVKALDEVLNISPLLDSSYFKKQVMNRNSFVAIDRMDKDGRREKTVRIQCILI